MPKIYLRGFYLVLLFSSFSIQAQTTLHPGDIIVLSWGSDMAACGVSPMADELSFMCFQDIETGTEIDITDNGWEHTNPGRWSDNEGTLRLTRTGGVIPQGTVITLQSRIVAGNWTYRIIAPDNNWTFEDLNVPLGGNFNIDPGGDQVYFMQGGTWDNLGGNGVHLATYDGTILWAANSLGDWTANGTVNTSNLHPGALPCYYSETSAGSGSPTQFIRFSGPISDADHFEWIERMHWWPDWAVFDNCTDYNASAPNYIGAVLPIEGGMGIGCWLCTGCSPLVDVIIMSLPWEGDYNVVYTDGVDTFEIFDINGITGHGVTLADEVSYWLVSVEKVGGCTVYSNFGGPANFTPQYRDPGLHGELYVCPNEGIYSLFHFLNGTPEPGGVWTGPHQLMPDMFGNLMYYSWWGPGTYTYVQEYEPPHTCEPDTASVTVYWVNIDDTVIEVDCDVNGTPYDITDDRIVVTATVHNNGGIGSGGFGPNYHVEPILGDVFPTDGVVGIPQTFTLDPGTATLPSMSLNFISYDPLWCDFWVEIPVPGFCSDPCDPDMETTISGPEDLCVQNCQVEAGTLVVDISGGTFPFQMDFTLTAPNNPPWTFPFVDIPASGEISICVDNVAAPIYNGVTGQLFIPQSLADNFVTFTLDQVYDFYGCNGSVSNDEVFINIHPLPPATTTTLSLCYDEAIDINLTDLDILINPFYDVTWWDGNPIQGGEEINSPTGANLTNVVQLWAQVTDDYCSNQIQVPFTIFPLPDLDSVPPINVCQGESIVLQNIMLTDAGNSMATYTFHAALPPDSSNMLDPLVYIPADSTTIYVHATSGAGMCYDTLPIVINVEDYPDFLLEATPCDLLNGTYSVLFTSSADSIYASAGVVTNNVTGQDAVTGIPNNLNITIEVLNPTGLCKDTIMITAPNCNCPQLNQPITSVASHAICEGEAIPVFSVSVDPGLVANWYDVPSGGVALLQNSLTFQPILSANSTYYAEALDPTSNCYSIRTPVTLQVNQLPVLQQQADPVLCDGETINLNTLAPVVLNGVPGTGGWFTLPLNQPASGVVQPQDGASWQYVFTTTQGACEDRDTIAAVVHPLPTINIYDIVCDDVSLMYTIYFTTDADVVLNSIGTLVQVGTTDSFSVQQIAFDTDVQFDLEFTATGCASTFTQVAPDCSCPQLLQNNTLRLCSPPGTVDLSTFEGPGVNGTWQIVSGPGGGNPATLAGSNFQGLQKDAGRYDLRFIRSILLANCVDTATFQLDLQTSPFADAGADGLVCAPDAITLAGTASGDNVLLQWQTNGTGSITNPGAINTSYTPTLVDITSGSVTFTLNAVDQTGFCPAANESIDITIDGSAYYILNAPAQTYCDTSNLVIDLDDLITFGNTNGEWFFPDTVNAPVTGSSQISIADLTAGNYTIFYTTTNAIAPCTNDTTAVSLIIENCACPSVAITNPTVDLCSESDALNLNTLLLTTELGVWSIVNAPAGTKPAVINGTQFVTSGSDEGFYRIRFTLSNPVSGCPTFSETSIEVIGTPVITVSNVQCAGDLQSWEAIVTSTDPIVSSVGVVVPMGGNQYRIEGITLNTAIQVTASSGNGLCVTTETINSADCDCTLSIANLPDEVELCPDETITLEGQVLDPKGTVTSYWIVENDSLYQNTIEVSEAGDYEFVATDALGCKEQHTVTVEYYEELVPGVNWIDVTCPGDHDGIIVLQGITGGIGPFFASFNGGPDQALTGFPFMFENLAAGNYTIELTDGEGCKTEFEIEIKSASSETLSLGPDLTILTGDTVRIKPLLSFVPDSFYWTGNLLNLLIDQLDQVNAPEEDQVFQLYAIDEKGCVYVDELKIRVLLESSMLVPNVFSPNEDGINDFLAPSTDPSITMIDYFEIYSRWGELVYSNKGFVPNQPNEGWDGKMRGEDMMPGVYIYKAKAVNKKGKEILQFGNVTLLR